LKAVLTAEMEIKMLNSRNISCLDVPLLIEIAIHVKHETSKAEGGKN